MTVRGALAFVDVCRVRSCVVQSVMAISLFVSVKFHFAFPLDETFFWVPLMLTNGFHLVLELCACYILCMQAQEGRASRACFSV